MDAVFDFIRDEGEATVMDIYMGLSGPEVETIKRHLRSPAVDGRVAFWNNSEGDRVYRVTTDEERQAQLDRFPQQSEE